LPVLALSVPAVFGQAFAPAPAPFATGTGVFFARGDVDGDGIPDLVVNGSAGGAPVKVFHGQGGGNYLPVGSYSNSAWLDPNHNYDSGMRLVDLNGDGKLDYVASFISDVSTGSGFISSRLNNGVGGFGPDTTYSLPSGQLDVGDVNSDGKLDLVVADYFASRIWFFPGLGSGAFATGISTPVSSGAYGITLADVDGDGKLDAITILNAVEIRLGNGSGGWSAPIVVSLQHPNSTCVRLADVTGDGLRDLVTSTSTGFFEVARGTGGTGFAASVATNSGISTYYDFETADMDGDGKVEVIAGDMYDGRIGVLRCGASGAFASPEVYVVDNSNLVAVVRVGQEGGDAFPDVYAWGWEDITSTSKLFVLSGKAGGGLRAPRPSAPNAALRAFAMGDVNGDGRPDIVGTIGAALTTSLGDGTGSFGTTLASQLALPFAADRLRLGDLNGDKKLDAVVVFPNDGRVGVCLGDGSGGFAPATTYSVPTNPIDVEILDLNGDGKLDVACVCRIAGQVAWLLGDGTGHLASAGSATTDALPNHLIAGEFTGDPQIDVAAPGEMFGTAAIWKAVGGGLQYSATFGPLAKPWGLAAGDLNLDGVEDLVALTGAGSPSSIEPWLGFLTVPGFANNYALATPFPQAGLGSELAVADFDGDGFPDVVANEQSLPQVRVVRGTGTGAFGASPLLVPGGSLSIPFPEHLIWQVAACDLNADGKEDLVVATNHPISASAPRIFAFVNETPTPAGISTFGTGTRGCAGRLAMGASASPKINSPQFKLTTTNAPRWSTGLVLISDQQDAVGSDPFGLGALLHVGLVGASTFTSLTAKSDAAGQAFAATPIPNAPSFVGATLYVQSLFVESTANGTGVCTPSPFGIVTSNGLRMTFQP